MKIYQVRLVLEEITDNRSMYQIETHQVRVYETEEEGRALFEAAQDLLHQRLT